MKSNSTDEIISYVAAYKSGDTSYSYRLYNKDSLQRVQPSTETATKQLRTTAAIFGVFEKNINNKDTIDFGGGKIRNARLSLDDQTTGTYSMQSSSVRVNTLICMVTVKMTLFYDWVETSYIPGQWVLEGYTLEVDIFCDFSGTTGTTPGNPDPNDSNFAWWQFGTGWYYNSPYAYDLPDPWSYFWTSGSTTSTSEILPDPLDFGNFDDDDETYREDYATITFDANTDAWPTISNVLSTSDFVVYYAHANCLDLARSQIGKAGVSDLGYGSAFKTYTELGGVSSSQAKSGVDYIITKLQAGKPVMIGVDNRPGSPSTKNPDNSTDHFVTIVGSGSDAQGNYFTFFDNATNLSWKGCSSSNKLYYNPSTGKITGASMANGVGSAYHDYIVTQIRKNN